LGRSRLTNAWKKRALLIMRMERSAETHQRASYSKDDDNDFTNTSTSSTDLDNTHDLREKKSYRYQIPTFPHDQQISTAPKQNNMLFVVYLLQSHLEETQMRSSCSIYTKFLVLKAVSFAC
jgi:nitrate reductase cytochrome c-type subunit